MISRVITPLIDGDLTKAECGELCHTAMEGMGYGDKYNEMIFNQAFARIDRNNTGLLTNR